ncbi:MAG: DUF4037 domain-containing protein [Oscillospiraceae bacterium]|nr:DUF4037 domain-containing protein [Oscillospiraceae bacterium]
MVNELFRELSSLPQVEAIALGGSRAGAHYDEKSDYDIYLYCTSPISEETRREILGKYASYVEYGNHFWELEDNGTLKNGIDFDLLFRNLDDFTAGVAAVVEDFQASNGYTTCMWHNLRTCKIIYDENGRLAAAKARFDVPYPARLKENIITRNRMLLSGMLPSYDGQIRKAAGRDDKVSICHRTAAFMESYFDIIWALNEQSHPGEKRLVSLCKAHCKKLPNHFEENLNTLYHHLFTEPDMISDDLTRIVEELGKLL